MAGRTGRGGPWQEPALDRLEFQGVRLIILGVILLIIGFVAKIPVLWSIGLIVLVIGVILALLGATGRAIGGRRHYF